MKIIYILVILNNFAFLLNADEEAKTVVTASPKADEADEEKIATTRINKDDGIVKTDDIIKGSEFNRLYYNDQNTNGGTTAFLRDPSNDDEVYQTATLSIKSKNNSNKEKSKKDQNKNAPKIPNEEETTESYKINSKEISKSAENNITSKENDTNVTESRTFEEKDTIPATNRTTKEKDVSVEENGSSKEKVKNVQDKKNSKEKVKSVIKKVMDKKVSSNTSDKKSSEAAAEIEKENKTSSILLTPKERSAIDDMDDLIIPYELNKFRLNDGDDDYDKTLYAKTKNSHEDEQHTLDGALQNYHQNRRMFDSIPVLDNNGRPESNVDLEPILPTFKIPTRTKDADLYHTHFNILPFLQTSRPPQPYLNNIQSLPTYNKISNPMMNIQPYQPNNFNRRSQSQEAHSPNRWGEFPETLNNGWSYPQEMANNPNRFDHIHEMPNNPNKFHKSQEMLSNPFKWTHPQEMSNNLNRWSQSEEFPIILNRWKTSEELKDSSEYKNIDEASIPSDSNAYPYVPPQTNKVPESNMNPIFMKLAQASHIPQKPQNLPSFPFRHLGFYRPLDPRFNIPRNFAFMPRFRRFSLENYH